MTLNRYRIAMKNGRPYEIGVGHNREEAINYAIAKGVKVSEMKAICVIKGNGTQRIYEIGREDAQNTKTIPLDKARLKEVIDTMIFASVFVKDQSDLHYSLNATITLFEEIQNYPKGTLLELI